jgi:UDP-N-acetylmuramoyl-L-alanyl-D-glutamate--2,6-diaminopimelate ligase
MEGFRGYSRSMPESGRKSPAALAPLLPALGRELRLRGSPETTVGGLTYDSRRVEAGDLFTALPGLHTDGHRFIEQAIRRGAAAILHQEELSSYKEGITYLQVPDSRRGMSALAAAFYENPSRELSIIGVTGTDGKSTTVWLIHQLLEAFGKASGFISTVQIQTEDRVIENPLRQSTPEAPDIHRLLRRMADAGNEYAVIEATSHGLASETGRLSEVEFAAGVCTNISHEHLEFHGSFEQYRSDKANLFRALPRHGFGVVNLNDPSHHYLVEQSGAAVLRYGLANPEADLWAENVQSDLSGSQLTLHYAGQAHAARLNLPGSYNIENLLAAALTVLRLNPLGLPDLAAAIPALKGVPGRMESISRGQPFRVIVDYAHTPQSYARVLPLVRSHTRGRLIVVFGSAGERDLGKRPLQGELAARYCDIVILTDEDPRGEEPAAILEQIAEGCRREKPELRTGDQLIQIPDRREAVSRALGLAKRGDTVLLLGKGHERSIIYGGGPIPWLEAQVAREILEGMGWKR